MRVLMLAQFYPQTSGGEERHVQDLSIQLARRGHQVAVATLRQPNTPTLELDHGVRVHRIQGVAQRTRRLYSESSRRHAPPFPDPELVLQLRNVILQERPQIVHAHNWLVHSFLPLKPWSAAKLVLSLHDYSLVCAKKSLMHHSELCAGPSLVKCLACSIAHYGKLKGIPTALGTLAMSRWERRQVDMFIAVSKATAVGNGLARNRLPFQIIPNFVPDLYPDERAPDPALDALPQDFILFVGDLSARKGIHVLLDAYSGLPAAPPLVIVGRRLSESPVAFPPNVIVLDELPHRAVMQVWRRCHFALAPSIWNEPFGIVALEAMAARRPMIASRIGGLADAIVDGETGLLVPPGDALALRTAICQLLDNPALTAQMGRAGQRRAADFQAETVVPKIVQLYEQLLAPVPAASRIPNQEPECVPVGQS